MRCVGTNGVTLYLMIERNSNSTGSGWSIPTIRETELEAECEQLRTQLTTAQAYIEQLEGVLQCVLERPS